ncbi:MAG: DUF1616 domain-containing protein [Candidatus Syntropharchaeia archaeon]
MITGFVVYGNYVDIHAQSILIRIQMIGELFRIVFGLILIFFLPGYALSFVIFPKKKEITLLERIALSFGLSMASVLLTVLFIDLALGIPTTPKNIAISILSITVVALVIWTFENQ